MTNWYYAKGQAQLGPVSLEELQRQLAGGGVSPHDLVWREGMSSWQPASSVPELAGAAGAGASMPPPPQQQWTTPAPHPSQPLPYGGYGYPPGTPPPPNYLAAAILTTLLCCMPMGIASIVFAAQVNSKHASGDINGAIESSNKAKFWAWMAFGFGLGGTVLWFALAVVGGIAEGGR
jgi:hypothetical protein